MLRTAGNRITWLGHATFQITTASGKTILIDPWIEGNPKFPAHLKKFSRVDLILVTHGHGDHCASVVPLAREHKAPVVAIVELADWFLSKGVADARGMGKGGTLHAGEVEVRMVHADHTSSVEQDGQAVYVGEPAGLVVKLPGGFTLYHAGDTAVFGDMKLIAELYRPDVVCLPIGGYYTMDPREAALAIRLLGALHVIPMHYGTFPALTGTPEALREFTQDIAGLEIHALQPGESLGETGAAAAR